MELKTFLAACLAIVIGPPVLTPEDVKKLQQAGRNHSMAE